MTVQCDGWFKQTCETAKEYAKDAFDYVRNNPAKALLVAELLSGGGVSATAGGTTGLMTPAAAAFGDTFVKTTVATGSIVLGAAAGVDAATGHVVSNTVAATTPGVAETAATGVGIIVAANAIEK